MDVRRDLGAILWGPVRDEIVSPIVEFLQMMSIQSRFWWCSTSDFSPLPLHAIGEANGISPISTSCITPPPSPSFVLDGTVSLILQRNGNTSLLSVKQKPRARTNLFPSAPNWPNIGQNIDSLTTFTRIEGPESCIAQVILGKNEWVHLACHNILNQTEPVRVPRSRFTMGISRSWSDKQDHVDVLREYEG